MAADAEATVVAMVITVLLALQLSRRLTTSPITLHTIRSLPTTIHTRHTIPILHSLQALAPHAEEARTTQPQPMPPARLSGKCFKVNDFKKYPASEV